MKCGAFEELVIYTHPVTKKHLHLARIVFMEVPSARLFIEKYHDKSVMGKVRIFIQCNNCQKMLYICIYVCAQVLLVFNDPFGH